MLRRIAGAASIGSLQEFPGRMPYLGRGNAIFQNGFLVPLSRLVLRRFWRQNGVKAPLPGRLESVRSEL
jgi:hypothetical protein